LHSPDVAIAVRTSSGDLYLLSDNRASNGQPYHAISVYRDLSKRTSGEGASRARAYEAPRSFHLQIQKYPEAVFSSPLPSAEEVAASLDGCRSGESPNGIPSILRAIPPFDRMIEEHGRGHRSLQEKMYPSQEWAVSVTDVPCS
jgi:hypothetical protein